MSRSESPTSGSIHGCPGEERAVVSVAARSVTPFAAALFVALASCGPKAALWRPTPEMLAASAPDSFVVEFLTSEGSFDVAMHRAWSPLGVDRMYHLIGNDFYAGARVYRMASGFVAQWGFSGNPT